MRFYKFSKNRRHVCRRNRYNQKIFRFILTRIVVDFFVITRRNLKSKFDEKLKDYAKTLNEKQNQIKIRIDKRLKIIIKYQK